MLYKVLRIKFDSYLPTVPTLLAQEVCDNVRDLFIRAMRSDRERNLSPYSGKFSLAIPPYFCIETIQKIEISSLAVRASFLAIWQASRYKKP